MFKTVLCSGKRYPQYLMGGSRIQRYANQRGFDSSCGNGTLQSTRNLFDFDFFLGEALKLMNFGRSPFAP
jgi:hypothetical protein